MHKSRLIVILLIRSRSEKKPNRTNKGAIGTRRITNIESASYGFIQQNVAKCNENGSKIGFI